MYFDTGIGMLCRTNTKLSARDLKVRLEIQALTYNFGDTSFICFNPLTPR